jgi:hypothetical protein
MKNKTCMYYYPLNYVVFSVQAFIQRALKKLTFQDTHIQRILTFVQRQSNGPRCSHCFYFRLIDPVIKFIITVTLLFYW